MKSLIRELTQIYSPSGNEEMIRNKIINEIKPYVDSITVDNLGNVIAKKDLRKIDVGSTYG